MRIIHTADWHLGKTLKNQPLIDDQSYILNELVKIIDDARADAVIIAGDIFDRSVPPVEAVALFDEIIYKIIERGIPVLSISGNHDSAGRLSFGSRLFERANFFINAKAGDSAPVVLEDDFGEIYFTLMPFFRPVEVKDIFGGGEDFDDNAATRAYIEAARRKIPAGRRSVAVAHLFATGGVSSESERKFVGAVENIDAGIFAEYNYTALGHLHRPQNITATVRYSGAILKYSFDEADSPKGVSLVEIDGGGNAAVENIELKPRRDVRIVEGTVKDLRAAARTDDYIHANLTDARHILYAMDTLRGSAFPNILSLSFTKLERAGNSSSRTKRRAGISALEYFADFFEFETGRKLDADERGAMESFLAEIGGE